MAYTALYREMRPKVFKDVIGQKHITTTLKNELITGRIAHAYLFSGTRGTGKTTCAKIFAKALNCTNLKDGEPCNTCENCKRIDAGLSLDVVEMDAATNNSVDDIRALIEEVQYPPQEGKYKVYILDEVHMMSGSAFNAFLKTLEEPPTNVVFIMATTDPQKLPVTILSRCQRFDFKRIKSSDIEERLREILEEKGIKYDNQSLGLISRVSEGAMRDALSILDQSISMGNGEVNYEVVTGMLGLMGRRQIFELVDAIINKNLEKAMTLVDTITDAGKDPYYLIKDLIEHFRNILVTKVIRNNPEELLEASTEDIEKFQNQSLMTSDFEIVKIIRVLQNAEESSKKNVHGRIHLELALIKICKVETDAGLNSIINRIANIENTIKSGNIPQPKQEIHREEKPVERMIYKPKETVMQESSENPDSKLTLNQVKQSWPEVEEALRAKRQMIIKASLYEVNIKSVDKGVITLEFDEKYSHSKMRLEKPEYLTILTETISAILGERVSVRFIVSNSNSNSGSSVEEVIRRNNYEDIDIL